MKITFHITKVQSRQLLNRSFTNEPCLFLAFSTIPANSNLPAKRTGTWVRLGYLGCLSVRDVMVSYISTVQWRVTHETTGMTTNDAGAPVLSYRCHRRSKHCTVQQRRISHQGHKSEASDRASSRPYDTLSSTCHGV